MFNDKLILKAFTRHICFTKGYSESATTHKLTGNGNCLSIHCQGDDDIRGNTIQATPIMSDALQYSTSPAKVHVVTIKESLIYYWVV